MLNDFCHRNSEMRSKIFHSFLFLATVFTLCVTWQKTPALNYSQYTQSILQQNTCNNYLLQLNLPGERTAVFLNREFLAEEETTNNSNSGTNSPAENATPHRFNGDATTQTNYLSFSDFIEEHSPVPLFVLYHAWKSFIA